MEPAAGFREHAHTADWELEVWAPDLAGLLEQSARGMYALSGLRIQAGVKQTRQVNLQGEDAEELLVGFLTELLWLEQQDGVGFDRFSIKVDDSYNLHAEMSGAAIANLDKEIKAVTYHNMEIKKTSQGLRVTIIFDV